MTVPRLAPALLVSSFLKKSSDWIERHLIHIDTRQAVLKRQGTEYLEKRKEAREIIENRVHELATQYDFQYQKISIRNQRTRFGSCSKSGNLSFHYQIAFFSEEKRDYVIIHELCHLRHFNHSPDFWREVAKFSPRYELIRKELMRRGHS